MADCIGKQDQLDSKDKVQSGHIVIPICNDISMSLFNPAYQFVMDKSFEQWNSFRDELPIEPQDEVYSYAYWLFRYSGLIKPVE